LYVGKGEAQKKKFMLVVFRTGGVVKIGGREFCCVHAHPLLRKKKL